MRIHDEIACKEMIEFIDVDIHRKDETFYQLHIDFFIEHLGTEHLVFFTSEDVSCLDNFDFLRMMTIDEEAKLDLVRDIDYNDIFFLANNTKYFNGLDVCLILNGAVDVMVMRKEDIASLLFIIEDVELIIKDVGKYS